MDDILMSIIAIVLATILMFIFPLMTMSDRTDDISQLSVKLATTEFVDDVRTSGKITLERYGKFLEALGSTGNIYNVDPLRVRKLLLNKREILKLISSVKQDGYSLIPLQLYLKNGLIKMELGVAKGKKLYDKRQSIAERDAKREIERETRGKNDR